MKISNLERFRIILSKYGGRDSLMCEKLEIKVLDLIETIQKCIWKFLL